jgi:hypothetical protein
MLEYLSLYPGTNPELRRDYAEYLQQSSGQDYSMLLMFKLLAFLQLL